MENREESTLYNNNVEEEEEEKWDDAEEDTNEFRDDEDDAFENVDTSEATDLSVPLTNNVKVEPHGDTMAASSLPDHSSEDVMNGDLKASQEMNGIAHTTPSTSTPEATGKFAAAVLDGTTESAPAANGTDSTTAMKDAVVEDSIDASLLKPLKPPQFVAHFARLVIKLFYHTKPNFRLILELLLEGPRTKDQVHQMLLGDIESSEDLKMFKEEYIRDITINPNAMVSGDVIDGEMKSFALEATDDLTFNPYGSRLTDHEMAKSLGLPLKDVQSFLGKLVLDQLICVDTNWKPPKTSEQKNEERKEALRKSKRTKTADPVLYYIDYVQFINVVQLRLSKLEKSIDEVEQEREVDYACESCGQHYSISQVIVLATQKCLKCGGVVNETQDDQNLTNISEAVNQYKKNIAPLKKLLAKCQEFVVSKNHTHKLKEFITKTEAEKLRQYGDKILADEKHDRKRRRRMEQIIKPVEKLTSSAFRPLGPPKPVMPAEHQTPHFLNSSKSQIQLQQQRLQEENMMKERENTLFQQQAEEEQRREQARVQHDQVELIVEEKEQAIVDSNPLVKVAGVSKYLNDVTEEDLDKMTSEEYEAYEAHTNRIANAEMTDDF